MVFLALKATRMDSMEDSGFDSDPKTQQNGITGEETQFEPVSLSLDSTTSTNALKGTRKTSELQRKLAKQQEAARKIRVKAVDQQPKKSLLSRSRLRVPVKHPNVLPTSADQQPLVAIGSDESEDEFAVPRISVQAQREITEQLIKDGYNLDLEPDDEDLDLIPPRPLQDRCICCNTQLNCSIQ